MYKINTRTSVKLTAVTFHARSDYLFSVGKLYVSVILVVFLVR